MKRVQEMRLIEAKRSTKWIDKYVIYDVVSGPDSFGYFKVQEPRCIGGRTHFIHKSNMKKVTIVQSHVNQPSIHTRTHNITTHTHTHNKDITMIKKLFYSHLGIETLIIAACMALVIAACIFGTWALLLTL